MLKKLAYSQSEFFYIQLSTITIYKNYRYFTVNMTIG